MTVPFIILSAKNGVTRFTNGVAKERSWVFWRQLSELSRKTADDMVEVRQLDGAMKRVYGMATETNRGFFTSKGFIQLREGISPKSLRGIRGFCVRVLETVRFFLSQFVPASKAEMKGLNPFKEAADDALKAAKDGFPSFRSRVLDKITSRAVDLGVEVYSSINASQRTALREALRKNKLTEPVTKMMGEAVEAGAAYIKGGTLVFTKADFVPVANQKLYRGSAKNAFDALRTVYERPNELKVMSNVFDVHSASNELRAVVDAGLTLLSKLLKDTARTSMRVSA